MNDLAVPEIGPILVPVDFSRPSATALLWGARLAGRLDVPFHVLHVVHDPEAAPSSYVRAGSDDHPARIDDAARAIMAEFLGRLRAEHPDAASLPEIEPIFESGLPVTRILEVAERVGACLIVMGSRGRTGLPHLLLGSKAERIAQLSPIPVTIVKETDGGLATFSDHG